MGEHQRKAVGVSKLASPNTPGDASPTAVAARRRRFCEVFSLQDPGLGLCSCVLPKLRGFDAHRFWLCRYVLRHPISLSRLSLTSDGRGNRFADRVMDNPALCAILTGPNRKGALDDRAPSRRSPAPSTRNLS